MRAFLAFSLGVLPCLVMGYTITASNTNQNATVTFTAEPAISVVSAGKTVYCPTAGGVTPTKIFNRYKTQVVGCQYTLPANQKNLLIQSDNTAGAEYFYTAKTNCSVSASGWALDKSGQMAAHMPTQGGIRLSVGQKTCSIAPNGIPTSGKPVFYAMPARQLNIGENYFSNGTLPLLILNNNAFTYNANQGKYTAYFPNTAGQFSFSSQVCTANSLLCGPEGVLRLQETYSGSGTHKQYRDRVVVQGPVLASKNLFANLQKTAGCQVTPGHQDLMLCQVPVHLAVPKQPVQTQNITLYVYQGIRAKTIAELDLAAESQLQDPTDVKNPIQYGKTQLKDLNIPALFDLNSHHVYYFSMSVRGNTIASG